MAQVDHSIYFRQQTPDLFGGFQKGMSMRDLMDQRALKQQELERQQKVRDAYKAGMQVGPDGQVTFNEGMTIGQLAQAGAPEQAMDLYNTKLQREIQAQQRQAEQDWKQKQFGFEKDKFQADQKWKEKELALRQREAERKALEAKQKSGYSVGQKKVDQEFAKDYNEWTSGGAKTARSEINKLQSVVDNLKSKKVTTGGLTGMFPDRMTSDEVLAARADVQSTVMNSLRAILGAQFTEKEGDRIIKNTWNEADSTDNNVARLERLIGDLEAQAAAKDAKARYYENSGGTLSNYRPASMSAQSEGGGQGQARTYKTNEIEWMD